MSENQKKNFLIVDPSASALPLVGSVSLTPPLRDANLYHRGCISGIHRAQGRRHSAHQPACTCYPLVTGVKQLTRALQIAEKIRPTVDKYQQAFPALLEIPSKDHPYDPSKDSILKRVQKLSGD